MNDFKSDSKNPAQQEAKANGSEVQASTSTLDKDSQQGVQPHKTDGAPSEKADRGAASDEASQAAVDIPEAVKRREDRRLERERQAYRRHYLG